MGGVCGRGVADGMSRDCWEVSPLSLCRSIDAGVSLEWLEDSSSGGEDGGEKRELELSVTDAMFKTMMSDGRQ